jgi:hypothetical protein
MRVLRNPTERELALVRTLARGLEAYHSEPEGSIACWLQAVNILIDSGPLSLGAGFEAADFLRCERFPSRPMLVVDNEARK